MFRADSHRTKRPERKSATGPSPLGKRFRLALLLLSITLLTGVIGFKSITQTTWLDALYLTVVTLSTVGYGDVVARGEEGHLFTTMFIFLGIGSASFSAAVIMGGFIEGEIQGALKRHRIMKKIESFRNHVILCGFGRVGESAAERLTAERVPFVIIEHDPARLLAAEEHGHAVLSGDATHDETLETAGIAHARSLITTLANDSENLFIVLSARQLNAKLRIVARASQVSNAAKMRKAGADDVALPEHLGAQHLTQAAIRPAVLDFVQFSNDATGQAFQVEEVPVKADAPIAGRTLIEANLRAAANIIVLGIKRRSGELVFNPNARTHIESGDTLVVVGQFKELDKLRATLHVPAEEV